MTVESRTGKLRLWKWVRFAAVGFICMLLVLIIYIDSRPMMQPVPKSQFIEQRMRLAPVSGLRLFFIRYGNYPKGESGLETLHRSIQSGEVQGLVRREVLLFDYLNQPLHYESDGQRYTLTSPGEDGELGSSDDIVIRSESFDKK